MFDRVRIKAMAQTALKRNYWIAVLVAVLVGLLGGQLANGLVNGQSTVDLSGGAFSNILNYNTDTDVDIETNPWQDNGSGTVWDEYDNPVDEFSAQDLWADIQEGWNEIAGELGMALTFFIGILVIVIFIAILFGALFTIFVSNVMTVSGHGWMLRHWRGENVSVGETFAGFRIYKPCVVTMLVRGIYIWLWRLLLIIPGIVMGYAYSMAPYIIYENPNLTANQALKMSKTMTDGYKFDLFVLKLSFIGWVLLSAITGGLVGIFYANPYMALTHAGTYDDLKWKAIQAGKLTWEDFGQVPPAPFDPFEAAWSTPAPNTTTQEEVWHTPSHIHE